MRLGAKIVFRQAMPLGAAVGIWAAKVAAARSEIRITCVVGSVYGACAAACVGACICVVAAWPELGVAWLAWRLGQVAAARRSQMV